tara:strand:- start:146 stop:316 length:171 start_codon:yes stop_codon:yes gene_type:complete
MTKRLTKTIPPKKGPKSQGMDIPYGKIVPVGSVPEDKKRKKGYGIASKGLKFEGVF